MSSNEVMSFIDGIIAIALMCALILLLSWIKRKLLDYIKKTGCK